MDLSGGDTSRRVFGLAQEMGIQTTH